MTRLTAVVAVVVALGVLASGVTLSLTGMDATAVVAFLMGLVTVVSVLVPLVSKVDTATQRASEAVKAVDEGFDERVRAVVREELDARNVMAVTFQRPNPSGVVPIAKVVPPPDRPQ